MNNPVLQRTKQQSLRTNSCPPHSNRQVAGGGKVPPPGSVFSDTPLSSPEHSCDPRPGFETFSRSGYPTSMRHLARALPPPVAVAMVVAGAMALAAAAQGRASQNHLPAGRSAYFDNDKIEQVDWYTLRSSHCARVPLVSICRPSNNESIARVTKCRDQRRGRPRNFVYSPDVSDWRLSRSRILFLNFSESTAV